MYTYRNKIKRTQTLPSGYKKKTSHYGESEFLKLIARMQNCLVNKLKSPLTIIGANIEQLRDEYPGNGAIIEDTARRGREVQQLAEFINFTNAMRAEIYGPPGDKPKHSSATFEEPYTALHLKDAAESCAIEAHQAGIPFDYEIPDSFPQLKGAMFYARIVSFLTRDSLSRIESEPVSSESGIRLRCWHEKGNIIVEVRDSGSAPEPVKKAHRGPELLDSWSACLLMTQFLSVHAGGQLNVSAADGQTLIRVTLPVNLPRPLWNSGSVFEAFEVVAQPHSSTQSRLDSTEKTPQQSAHVLIVDDDLQMRQYLRILLRQLGYEVTEARNGMDALSILKMQQEDEHAAPVNLLISDLMMPVMDGFGLAGELKKIPGLQDLPCIFITARADQEGRLKALRLGINDYLTKPFEASELEARCRNILRLSAARAEARQLKEAPGTDTVPESAGEADQEVESISERFKKVVLQNITNSKTTLPEMAFELNMSERNLYRKIKEDSGLTPNAFIREVRLLKARELLEQGRAENLKQLGYDVGITQSSYLKKLYIERFGKDPMKQLQAL